MIKLPDLQAWAIFAKVAEVGSFARAASELGITQPTVSKAISRLEKQLNVALFHRTSRKMSLTGSGLSALDGASRILREGEELEARLRDNVASLRGTVRISAPMSFGISHLAPLIPAFMQAHPEVILEVSFSDELTDIVADGFDMALRISSLPDSSLLARRLCIVKRYMVGSPRYFELHGTPMHPRDLAQHRSLQYMYESSGNTWRFQHARHGQFAQTVPAFLRVNNAEALIPALCSGLGLAVQPEFLVWEELKAGVLTVAMPDWEVPPIALHLVTPPSRARPARVQVFMDYLAEHFAKAPWAHP
ncbi:LysR family transcriptional regulator [Paenalcaligenes niemegkensis]|uniref:LysR family transcriptional regulator n=1 Tax=Paenalcaligenes niemegkensis TaxID=2895469 RepID=UPI001EE97926|nr:LysR family transcriptional regulator [Paenalcaligenes niemegkensis]MCQ9615329.1 LysR family transcriptional regulator [Paenalcaligenes niemegkensis]